MEFGQHSQMGNGFVRGFDWSKKQNGGTLVTYQLMNDILDVFGFLTKSKYPPIDQV